MADQRPKSQGLGRPVKSVFDQRAEDSVRFLLKHIGEDPDRDGLKDTPARVVKAWREMTSGVNEDPAQILSRTFDVEHDQMVIVRGIRFVSLCEHHVLPFVGTATVGYIPGKRVVGLSKIPRLVRCFARRLQVQERLTDQIAEAMVKYLKPRGVGVIIRARHECMACRGVEQHTAEMVTSALLGAVRKNPAARQELLALSGPAAG